jgi:hypothetical protein
MFLELKVFDNYWASVVAVELLSIGFYLLLKRAKILNYLLFGGTDIPIKISKKLEVWYGKTKA